MAFRKKRDDRGSRRSERDDISARLRPGSSPEEPEGEPPTTERAKEPRSPGRRQRRAERAAAVRAAKERVARREAVAKLKAERRPALPAGSPRRAATGLGTAGKVTAERIASAGRRARPHLEGPARRSVPLLRRLGALPFRLIAWSAIVLSTVAVIARAGVLKLDRVLTPARGAFLVTAGAAVMLGVSQFVDYRGVQVGQPDYAGVSAVAPPPQTDKVVTGEAHSYILLGVAAIALLLALVAVSRRRWRLGRLVALAGISGVVVSLAIDLPKGLDEGKASIAYAGAKATLEQGFYAQLAASAVLGLSGLLLGMHLRHAAPQTQTPRTARRRLKRAPAKLAEGGA